MPYKYYLIVLSRTLFFIMWIFFAYNLIVYGRIIGDNVTHKQWDYYQDNRSKFIIYYVCMIVTGPIAIVAFYKMINETLGSGKIIETSKSLKKIQHPIIFIVVIVLMPLFLDFMNLFDSITYIFIAFIVIIILVYKYPIIIGEKYKNIVDKKFTRNK